MADPDMLSPDYWDAFYTDKPQVWSGHPNPHLLAHATDLTPGTALDVGAGEGADAVWLAGRGWRVSAVDISTVALARGRAHAEAAGPDVAARSDWSRLDLVSDAPPPGRYDLVSAQFLHLPRPILQRAQRALAAAVAPGGTLLIVGHHPDDPRMRERVTELPDMFFTAEQVAAELDPRAWQVSTTAPQRPLTGHDGIPITAVEAVLLASRR